MNPGFRTYLDDFRFGNILQFDVRHLKGDFIGGLTSAIVALPLALGFGILAYHGDPRGAVAGLYGAIFTGIFASIFGGTPRQITGPTGGMTVILTTVYLEFGGADALLGACLIAGPADRLRTSQIRTLHFVHPLSRHHRLHERDCHPHLLSTASSLCRRSPCRTDHHSCHHRCPVCPQGTSEGPDCPSRGHDGRSVSFRKMREWARLSLDVSTGALAWDRTLELIGAILMSLSFPHLPSVDWKTWSRLFPAGITISLLGTLETLLASVVADSVTGDRHNSNRELVGQGIGNFIAGMFGGIAGTGAIVRTNVNIRAGGVTKLSGIIRIVLLVVMMALAPLVSMIPLVVLAGVLMMTAVGMFEWEPLRLLRKTPVADALVLVATMMITVIADLITAVLIGFALAGFLFVYKMSESGVTNLLEGNRPNGSRRSRRPSCDSTASSRMTSRSALFRRREEFCQGDRGGVRLPYRCHQHGKRPGDRHDGRARDRRDRRPSESDEKKVIIAGMRKEVRTVLHRLGDIREDRYWQLRGGFPPGGAICRQSRIRKRGAGTPGTVSHSRSRHARCAGRVEKRALFKNGCACVPEGLCP